MLSRITDFPTLSTFLPKLLALHAELDGKWEPDATGQEFISNLIESFEESNYFFGDFAPNGEVMYFVVVTKQETGKGLFWLFYMNKAFREKTKILLNEVKDYLKAEGFSTIYSQSTRTSSSYERWLEKFGAEKVAIIYKFKLT